MIKDLTKIREYLTDYVEVEMPYDFTNNCPIHYITCSMDTEGNVSCESFYPGFKFKTRHEFCYETTLISEGKCPSFLAKYL